MLTIEKLFYQHQYKPLELSTYLADYIRDAKSYSFKPEACSKRLYQLFHRFINKFSTFQDPSLSHLILSISFSVLTYLCETSRASFADFFEFGLASLLVDDIPLSDMTQNENTFSEFISLIHLLCDCYSQPELEQFCRLTVPLLDTVHLEHFSTHSHIQVSSLVIKLCDHLSPTVVMKLKSDHSFSTQIVKTGKRIGTLGDIFLQSDLVECIFRLTSKTERIRLSDILFISPAISNCFRDISESAFEKGSRNFLNTLNSSLAARKVFSYPCISGSLGQTVLKRPQELDHLWADFNSASQNLTLFVSHPLDASSTEWVTTCFQKENFTLLTLSSSPDGYQLSGTLSSDKNDICEVFPHSPGPISLQLSFSQEHNPTVGMTAALGYTGTLLTIPVKSGAPGKPHLFRMSTSMQAIRLTTHSSGGLSTQITSVSPHAQLEERVSPILRSPTPGSQQHPAVLQQHTTPVAPIPSLDPLTSTPIQKKSFTPIFTPNNIGCVREHNECVMASVSSLPNSDKISTQKNGNGSQKSQKPLLNPILRRFTPSSLTTHVNTPVNIIAIEDTSETTREHYYRAKIVTEEIDKNGKGLEKQVVSTNPRDKSPFSKNLSSSDKTPCQNTLTRDNTPRSIRVNNRKERSEVSHSYKPRATKEHRKHATPPPSPKTNSLTPMSVDIVTSSNDDNESNMDPPIQIDVSSNACSPLNPNATAGKTISQSSINNSADISHHQIDLTNSDDSVNGTPSPLNVGCKKLALSKSELSSILSPVLIQSGKYRRIVPRDTPPKNEIKLTGRNLRRATRITHSKPPTKQKQSSFSKSGRKSDSYSPIFTSDNSNSPDRMFTRARSRNCKLRSDQEQKTEQFRTTQAAIQDESNHSIEKSTSSKVRKRGERESPKLTMLSQLGFPKKQSFNKFSRDSICALSSANSLQIQTKNPPPIRSFSFKLDANNSNNMKSLDKHLQQYEDNLKFARSHSLIVIDKSRGERVKKLFVQMKDLMTSDNKDVFKQYNDWYHDTRNLVAAISEIRKFDMESKSYLYDQFQLAVKQVEQSIQKEQVSAIKKRIHSFFIKI